VGARQVSPGRFRRRLTVAFVLVAGVSAAALAIGAYLMVRQARLDGSLQTAAAEARYQLVLAREFLPLDDERTAGLLSSFEVNGRHVLAATGPDDSVVASNEDFAPVPSARMRAAVAAGQLAFERPPGRPHLLVVGGRIPGASAELYLVSTEESLHTDLGQLRNALLAAWLAVVLLAAGVGHTLARRTLEPVARAGRAARAVAEGLLGTRLPVRGRDEFGAWAESFDEMAAALEAKIRDLSQAQARERRFTADVAHELRTPVTALVAEASLLREQLDQMPQGARRPAELLLTDVVRLRRLVEELIEISRLDAGRVSVHHRAVDLSGLLSTIVQARNWTDRVKVTGEPVTLHTDPRRRERVLGNLLANAVAHGGSGVTASVRRSGAQVTVTIADRGPGIAPEHLPHLFDRFYKADPSRTGAGSGLGLAIAEENARLLGARLRVDSVVGAGTWFHVDLPAGGPPPSPPGADGHGPAASMIALTVALVMLAAGCANPRSGTLGPAPTPAPAQQASPAPAVTSSGAAPAASAPVEAPPTSTAPRLSGTVTVQLWFTRDGRLVSTRRTRPATLATSRLALTELSSGPSAAERRAGLSTGLPAEAGFAIEGISDRVATVDFGPAFYAGGAAAVRLRQAQVVYTLTQFPSVSRVRFRSGGEAIGPPGGRGEFADLLPPIVVSEPVIGESVTSPITVTGTADVFEATVSVRLLDGAGRQLATAFTTAACGSGCRGAYRVTLAYRSAGGGTGTVEVYQVSAKDGSRRDVVTVPVRLT
jgi:signal transduction histidine kinase